MSQPLSTPAPPTTGHESSRALRILAKSVFRELKSSGYTRSDMVSFTTELLSLVTSDIRDTCDAE